MQNLDQEHKHILLCKHFLIIFSTILQIQKLLSSLGGSFLYYADHFKLYSGFCANHIKVQKVLERGVYHLRTSSSLCGFGYTDPSRTIRTKRQKVPSLGFISVLVASLQQRQTGRLKSSWRRGTLPNSTHLRWNPTSSNLCRGSSNIHCCSENSCPSQTLRARSTATSQVPQTLFHGLGGREGHKCWSFCSVIRTGTW